MNRKRLLLAVLLGMLALSLAYTFWAMPRQQVAPPRSAKPAVRPVAKAGPVARQAASTKEQQASKSLNLALLKDDDQPFPGAGRDIFRFHSRPAPVAPALAVPAQPPPPPPPSPEELLRRELARYKVLGYLEKGGERRIFLTSGEEVVLVRKGKPFGERDRFVATEITATELVISSADRAVTVRLPLEGVDAREPAIMAPVSVPRGEVEMPGGAPGRRMGRRPPLPAEGENGVVVPAETPPREDPGAEAPSAKKELPSGEPE